MRLIVDQEPRENREHYAPHDSTCNREVVPGQAGGCTQGV